MENSKTEGKVSRAPNFTLQECHLLAELMGEEHPDFPGLSRHKLDKHKFTEKITSAKKKSMWRNIEEIFNKNSLNSFRKAVDLQKKWENLVSKHRAIYSDYVRDRNATGSAPCSSKYTILTEAIVSVIGKECAAVRGIGGISLDSTMNQLNKLTGQKASCTLAESNETKRCAECYCDEELVNLKKRS